jgi:hypothetical protein
LELGLKNQVDLCELMKEDDQSKNVDCNFVPRDQRMMDQFIENQKDDFPLIVHEIHAFLGCEIALGIGIISLEEFKERYKPMFGKGEYICLSI